MKWKDWISRTGQRWSTAFPECARQNCRRPAIPWNCVPVGRGIWLHESWFCSEKCFEPAVTERFIQARLPNVDPPPAQHRIPLGLLMLSRGVITGGQLQAALDAQRRRGGLPLGHWLEKLGYAREPQVTAALGLQWACPVLPRFAGEDSGCSGMVPLRLQASFRMLPVQFVAPTCTLHIAFSKRVEYTVLYAVEAVLGCRTQPCLMGRSHMDRALEHTTRSSAPGEILFEGGRDVTEMAHITCSYLHQVGAQAVRIAACGDYIWVRLQGASDISHLLFRRPGGPDLRTLKTGFQLPASDCEPMVSVSVHNGRSAERTQQSRKKQTKKRNAERQP
jgi:hypothetical protein